MNKEQWSASEWFVKMNTFVMVWSIPGIIKFFTRRMMVEMDLSAAKIRRSKRQNEKTFDVCYTSYKHCHYRYFDYLYIKHIVE